MMKTRTYLIALHVLTGTKEGLGQLRWLLSGNRSVRVKRDQIVVDNGRE